MDSKTLKKIHKISIFFSNSLLMRFTLHNFFDFIRVDYLKQNYILQAKLAAFKTQFIGITKVLWIVWLSHFELYGHLHKFLITDPVMFVGSIKSQFTIISSIFSTSAENDKNKGLHDHLGFSTNKGWRGDTQKIVLILTWNCQR